LSLRPSPIKRVEEKNKKIKESRECWLGVRKEEKKRKEEIEKELEKN